jgi:hypothetical protein
MGGIIVFCSGIVGAVVFCPGIAGTVVSCWETCASASSNSGTVMTGCSTAAPESSWESPCRAVAPAKLRQIAARMAMIEYMFMLDIV